MAGSPINPSAPGWPYEQVATVLAKEIRAGKWAPGSLFATERDLSARFGVARKTVRSALESLRSDGLIYTIPRRGTFVSTPTSGNT
ncbi:winged helix-turn-helix domain-containing protein [Kitasatospora cineracea]|uniref:GntR family transcriptional regulator n=1 Tax=Kitasatospora cineracea TaxID=88074 RepID=UPI003421F20F